MVDGNGEDTFLWIEWWHPKEPLTFSYQLITHFSSCEDAKVSSVIEDNSWDWPKSINLRDEALCLVQDTSPYRIPIAPFDDCAV